MLDLQDNMFASLPAHNDLCCIKDIGMLPSLIITGQNTGDETGSCDGWVECASSFEMRGSHVAPHGLSPTEQTLLCRHENQQKVWKYKYTI